MREDFVTVGARSLLDSRFMMKKSLCVLAVVGAAATVVACSSGRRSSVIASGHNARLPPSPCRGIDPWNGAALRRCTALIARWAPVDSIRLTTQLPPRVRSTCAQARRQVRVPIVCPPLVPADGVVSDPNLYGAESRGSASDFYLLTFNNGQTIPETLLWETVKELEEHFGALSWETQLVRGIWQHEGTFFRDNNTRLVMDVPDTPESRSFFETFKAKLKVRFQQVDIYLTSHPIDVH